MFLFANATCIGFLSKMLTFMLVWKFVTYPKFEKEPDHITVLCLALKYIIFWKRCRGAEHFVWHKATE